MHGASAGLDLPSGEVGAIVGNGQLEIAHAEIESSEIKLHPRLQPMCLSRTGISVYAEMLGYTGAFFFTLETSHYVAPELCSRGLRKANRAKSWNIERTLVVINSG